MVRLDEETSNTVREVLEDWNIILKDYKTFDFGGGRNELPPGKLSIASDTSSDFTSATSSLTRENAPNAAHLSRSASRTRSVCALNHKRAASRSALISRRGISLAARRCAAAVFLRASRIVRRRQPHRSASGRLHHG